MKKKIALVSGGAGFIGSHMVELLLKNNFEVRVIDNFSTGSIKNLKHLKNNKKLKLKKIDITKLNHKDKIFKSVDYVFHFAGIADLVPSIEQPQKYMMTNLIGTIKMLEASRYFNIKKFVYAASASCYGKTEIKVSEKAKINTEHPYAFSKYCGELAVQHWAKVYKLNFSSMRIFNAFGPRSRTTGAYGAVMGVFFKQKLENKPFTIVGTGKQSRDFIHVTDVVRAFLAAAQKKNSNEIFNVATSKPKSINLLTKIIGGKKVNIPNRPGESFKSHANISKIIGKLNWKPLIGFENGVKELIKSIEDWRQAPLWNKKNIKKATKTWFKYLR